MTKNLTQLTQLIQPAALFTVVAAVAYCLSNQRNYLLPLLFLLLPFVDVKWRSPVLSINRAHALFWLIAAFVIAVMLSLRAEARIPFFSMLLLAALPEEWFFRAYLQKRLGNGAIAILTASLMFSALHYITRGHSIASLVFVPSLLFGWFFKKTGDFVSVVMLHALSNLVYFLYIETYVIKYFIK